MTLRARDIMSKHGLVKVRPRTSLQKLDRILIENEVSGVPVVNEDDELVGVVSQSDLVRFLYRELDQNINFYSYLDHPRKSGVASLTEDLRNKEVWEIMQTRLHTAPPNADIPTLAKILRRHRIHRVLIVENKKLRGVVTSFDLVSLVEDPNWFRENFETTETAAPVEELVRSRTPEETRG